MMKIDDNLNEIFNLEPVERITGNLIDTDGSVIAEHNGVNQNIEDDYVTARNNLHTLLVQGQDALNNAVEIAKSSENPKAFEAVSKLMLQLSDINNRLLDLSEKRQKLLSSPEKNKEPTKVTQNAFFVGTTAELSNLMKRG